MSDHADDDSPNDIATDRSTEVQTMPVRSNYKVLGLLDADDGVGVLGQNDATSGTPIGVLGAVPNAADGGYGLYTPHDTKLAGTTELNTIVGSLTGGRQLSNLAGRGLSVDGDGNLNGHTYRTNTITSSGVTWDAVTGLSSETAVEVALDTNEVITGRASVDVDGSRVGILQPGEVLHRVVTPTSSVRVNTLDWWAFDTNYDVSAQEGSPAGVAFESNGNKMYVTGSGESIYSYTLGTAWDVSTASPANSFDVSSQDTNPSDVTFRPNGTKMFVSGESNDNIYSYTLSTPWDIRTASPGNSFGTPDPQAVTFKDDGLEMYVIQALNENLGVYTLSNSYDISTASKDRAQWLSLYTAYETPPGIPQATGIGFNGDGTKLYIVGRVLTDVVVYRLSTAWDPSTAIRQFVFDVSSEDRAPTGITFKPDHTRMYVTGIENSAVYSYELSYAGSSNASVRRE